MQNTLDIPVYGRISALRLFKPQVCLEDAAALNACQLSALAGTLLLTCMSSWQARSGLTTRLCT